MLANNNLKVCHTLAKRDFRFHRTKNLVLILAVAMVTGLYSFVFLLGSAVEGGFLLNKPYPLYRPDGEPGGSSGPARKCKKRRSS